MAAPRDEEWQQPSHVREMATAKGAEYTSKMAGIKAAFQGALVSANMEEAPDEEALSDEQHTEALNREMSEVYLKDYDGGVDKCFDAKYMTLYDITDVHSLHLSPRIDPDLRKVVDKWLASGTRDRPRNRTCAGMTKLRDELYRVRETYARDKRKAKNETRQRRQRKK
mmetsp:Transcript_40675/g.93542  ORF Transcript_40675/g.93542 Transcript_40675/m.93542 type:complete len:168 (+) Transcript_40675:254-757(+)